jgi:Flp pilus assembly protein TadD
LALAASIGVVALVAVSVFLVILRRPSETQSANLSANTAAPGASAQPTAQQSNQQTGATANNPAQPQTGPQSGPATVEVKSPPANNAKAASSPQQQVVAKPTPATSQQQQPVKETVSAEQYLKQGVTYLNSGRHQEALRDFEYVRQLDPGNKDVYYLIGQAYQRMNLLKQALEAYRQCTSGVYVSVSQSAVKNLEKRVGKVNEK